MDQLRDAIAKYLLPIFDPSTSIGAVAVNSGKAAELEEGYAKLGFTVEKKELPTLEGDQDGSEGESGDEDGSVSGDEASDDAMEDIRSP